MYRLTDYCKDCYQHQQWCHIEYLAWSFIDWVVLVLLWQKVGLRNIILQKLASNLGHLHVCCVLTHSFSPDQQLHQQGRGWLDWRRIPLPPPSIPVALHHALAQSNWYQHCRILGLRKPGRICMCVCVCMAYFLAMHTYKWNGIYINSTTPMM